MRIGLRWTWARYVKFESAFLARAYTWTPLRNEAARAQGA